MPFWILLFFVCKAGSQLIDNYPCPHPCECSVTYTSNEPTVHVFCAIPWINGNDTDFSKLETNVTSILHLQCSEVFFSFLQDYIFQHLHSFIVINIMSCSLNNIHEHSLYGLNALQELRIDKGKNLKIHDDAFVNTPNLRRLTITSSGMTQFPSLKGLNYLEYVNFTDNEIESIFTNITSDNNVIPPHLYVLILNNNIINEINVTLNQIIPGIKYIALADNKISHLSISTFELLTSLEFLDLSNNNLHNLSDNMLSGDINLKLFSLGSNPIIFLPSGIFSPVTGLHLLDLHATQISDRIWYEIGNLTQLIELQLGNCAITSIATKTISKLKMLQYLDLSGNRIERIFNNTFVQQRNLETLLLSHNSISMIDSNAFEGLQLLKKLDLTRNKLSSTHPSTFKFVQNLTSLNISYNVLKQFPTLHTLHKLFLLDLRYNKISSLDNTSLVGLEYIGGINMDWNKLRIISRNIFQQAPSLQLLHLSHNIIEFIDRPSFLGMKNLKWMFMDHNKIRDISYIFQNIPSLIQLDLSHNSINGQFHSGYFLKSTALQQINLSFNKISKIEPRAFYNMMNLDIVDLKFNSISSLMPQSLECSPLIKPAPAFYLTGNPFICDCHLSWMRKCLNRWTNWCKGLQIEEFEFLNCETGYRIQSYSLIKNVDADDMLCYFDEPCDEMMCDCCRANSCQCRMPCPKNCVCLMSLSHNNGIVDCSNQSFTNMNESIPYIARTLYLDGNEFTVFRTTMVKGLYQLETLYLNNSGISTIQNGSFTHLTKLKSLFLNGNSMTEINVDLLSGLSSLEDLHLEGNHISVIADGALNGLNSLNYLGLADNKLVSIDPYLLYSIINIEVLTLSENPWSCECSILQHLKEITYTLADIISDRKRMNCVMNTSKNKNLEDDEKLNLIDLDLSSLCPNHSIIYKNATSASVLSHKHVQALVATLVVIVLSGILAIVLFIYRRLIQVILYSKFGFRCCDETSGDDALYDAFVSYSHHDEAFVVHELLPRLEIKEGYKLCVHFRDFPVGASIADTIIESIDNSKRTIMIVSNKFLDSEWCQYEFKTAHHSVLKEKSQKIILILMENIDTSKLDQELKLYIKTNTYLKLQDPWFWEKIRYAMPDISKYADTNLNDLNKVTVEIKDNVENETRFHKNIF